MFSLSSAIIAGTTFYVLTYILRSTEKPAHERFIEACKKTDMDRARADAAKAKRDKMMEDRNKEIRAKIKAIREKGGAIKKPPYSSSS